MSLCRKYTPARTRATEVPLLPLELLAAGAAVVSGAVGLDGAGVPKVPPDVPVPAVGGEAGAVPSCVAVPVVVPHAVTASRGRVSAAVSTVE